MYPRDIDRDLFIDFSFLDAYLEEFVNYRDGKDFEGVLDVAYSIRSMTYTILHSHNLSIEDKTRLYSIVKNVNYDIECLLKN
jgi:hypothetical protein